MKKGSYTLLTLLALAIALFGLIGASPEAAIEASKAAPASTQIYHLNGGPLSVDIADEPHAADKQYRLYLNGISMAGLKPEITQGDKKLTLLFMPALNQDSAQAWKALFEHRPAWQAATMEVCAGPEDNSTTRQCVGKVKVRPISPSFFWLWLAIVVALVGFVCLIDRETSMLRDWRPTEANNLPAKPAAYSLARVQMAFWSVLILSSFLFIWLVTGTPVSLGNSALALMGIGSGTALGAVVIDASNKEKKPPSQTRGDFLQDLLTNIDGYGLHRVQMFVWTLALGVIFIAKVATTLALEEFDSTLLALMGISAGTYLGFKLPETKSEKPANV